MDVGIGRYDLVWKSVWFGMVVMDMVWYGMVWLWYGYGYGQVQFGMVWMVCVDHPGKWERGRHAGRDP